MSLLRSFLVCLLVSFAASAMAQQGEGVRQPGSSGVDGPTPAGQDGKRMSLMGFVVSSAYAAGAVGACEPPSALAIRDCVERIIPSWTDLTKLESPQPAVVDAIPMIWKDAYERARVVQMSAPPMPCGEVIARAKALPMWGFCSAPWR